MPQPFIRRHRPQRVQGSQLIAQRSGFCGGEETQQGLVAVSNPVELPIPRGAGNAGVDQGQKRDLDALRLQLPGHLEGDQSAERPAAHLVGTHSLVAADRRHVEGRHLFDGGPGRDPVRALQPIKRLLEAQLLGQRKVAEDLPADGRHAEERQPRSPGLDLHQRRPGRLQLVLMLRLVDSDRELGNRRPLEQAPHR